MIYCAIDSIETRNSYNDYFYVDDTVSRLSCHNFPSVMKAEENAVVKKTFKNVPCLFTSKERVLLKNNICLKMLSLRPGLHPELCFEEYNQIDFSV